MIIARKWLEKFVDLSNITDEELAERIGSRLVEVEEVIKNNDGKYDGIFVVEVKTCEKIADSDHLHLTFVDDCGIMERYAPDELIARNSKGWIPVVCGAPNVRAGMLAAWIAPGATVPSTFNDKEPFIIGAKKLRGHQSYGMLAAIDELDLGTAHDGILEIDRPEDASEIIGAPLGEVMGLGSTLLDIENKSLTHRPDCFGVIGFAREVAGIFGKPFATPDYLQATEIASNIERLRKIDAGEWAKVSKNAIVSADSAISLDVKIEDPALCPRYNAIILEDGLAKESEQPSEFAHLCQVGIPLMLSNIRTVNPLVDWSNYLMLLTGQPLHFFDYDKLLAVGGKQTASITIRAAKKGESLELINHKTIQLTERDTVITSNDVPIALAGVMGGLSTEIDDTTKRIVVESASFNLYRIRETSFRYGIFSEAVTRFTKGQPAALADQVVLLAATSLRKNLGFGLRSTLATDGKNTPTPTVTTTLTAINATLGSNYSETEVESALHNVNFDAGWADHQLITHPPYWRTDINIAEDIIEEIGRLLGFDNLAFQLPTRHAAAPAPDEVGDFTKLLRNHLASYGSNEALTYSFISRNLLEKCNLPTDTAYEIANSISPELQIIRPRLLPSLLAKLELNLRDLDRSFTIFELNQVFDKTRPLTSDGVPDEHQQLALLQTGSDFYTIKHWVITLLNTLCLSDFTLEPLDDPLYTDHSAKITLNGQELARFGRLQAAITEQFGATTPICAAEFLDLNILLNAKQSADATPRTPIAFSRFPSVKRDLSLTSDKTYTEILTAVQSQIQQTVGQDTTWTLEPRNIFAKDGAKTFTFHLTFTNSARTLLSAEVNAIMTTLENLTTI
ncbi:MAG: phenylalanine--tRNA ligase subunit beta [Candidatus Nomurabacteria bacterium]|jgi:phenylalanyl-tRNA synthetase beta chain|nr:phenylalanine--tRNA ligase subunit beta [Candidatus Nomurabacteria bacterium]